MHNFNTVLWFEVTRTLKKPTFWLSLLSIPTLMGVIFGIVYFSNQSTSNREEAVRNTPFTLVVQDETKLIANDTLTALKAKHINDKRVGIEQVKSGKTDAFFYYPSDVTKQPIEVYNKNDGLMDNDKYNEIAKSILKASATSNVNSPQIVAILNDSISTKQKNFEDGKEANIIGRLVPPMLFLIVFYGVIALFGNQMLTSTTEEKENRVTEMILTSISSRALIIGKIVSLIILGFIQIGIIVATGVLVYIFGKDTLNIPDIANILADLQFEVWPLVLGALVLLFGFLFFTGLLVAIGAAVPTAKEAGSFFGFAILLMIVPFWFFPMLMSPSENTIVTALTYFPTTAPVAILIRNAFDTLPLHEGLIGLTIVIASGFLAISAAIRIFRYGTLEYSNRISLKSVFGKKKRA